MTRWFTRMVAVALVSVGAAGSASADVLIDTFDTPAAATGYQITTAALTNPLALPGNGLISPGLTRTGSVTVTNPAVLLPNTSYLFGSIGGGNFNFSLPANAGGVLPQGFASLLYSYSVNQDFSAATHLDANFEFVDIGIPVHVDIVNSGGVRTFDSTATTGGGLFSALLSSFGGSGDFTSVSAINIFLNRGGVNPTVSAADFQINDVSLRVPPTNNPIPAPPAVFLIGAAVPVLAVRRHLAKRKAALAA